MMIRHLILKNKKIKNWVTHPTHPNQIGNEGVYPTPPNTKVGGYFA
jgi:hypothetical protein